MLRPQQTGMNVHSPTSPFTNLQEIAIGQLCHLFSEENQKWNDHAIMVIIFRACQHFSRQFMKCFHIIWWRHRFTHSLAHLSHIDNNHSRYTPSGILLMGLHLVTINTVKILLFLYAGASPTDINELNLVLLNCHVFWLLLNPIDWDSIKLLIISTNIHLTPYQCTVVHTFT